MIIFNRLASHYHSCLLLFHIHLFRTIVRMCLGYYFQKRCRFLSLIVAGRIPIIPLRPWENDRSIERDDVKPSSLLPKLGQNSSPSWRIHSAPTQWTQGTIHIRRIISFKDIPKLTAHLFQFVFKKLSLGYIPLDEFQKPTPNHLIFPLVGQYLRGKKVCQDTPTTCNLWYSQKTHF